MTEELQKELHTIYKDIYEVWETSNELMKKYQEAQNILAQLQDKRKEILDQLVDSEKELSLYDN